MKKKKHIVHSLKEFYKKYLPNEKVCEHTWVNIKYPKLNDWRQQECIKCGEKK